MRISRSARKDDPFCHLIVAAYIKGMGKFSSLDWTYNTDKEEKGQVWLVWC